MSRLQRAELLDDQEQEEDDGPAGVFQVLQSLPQAHGSQGNQVAAAAYPKDVSPGVGA
jgi:hypothetical protein